MAMIRMMMMTKNLLKSLLLLLQYHHHVLVLTLLLISSCSNHNPIIAAASADDDNNNNIQFKVINNASETPGGQVFDQFIGEHKALANLFEASTFAYSLLYNAGEEPAHRHVSEIWVMVIKDTKVNCKGANVQTEGNRSIIHFCQGTFLPIPDSNQTTEFLTTFKGHLMYLTTWVWMNFPKGKSRAERVLKFSIPFCTQVRAKLDAAKLAYFVGTAKTWTDNDVAQGFFLDYLENRRPGFVKNLNARFGSGIPWSNSFFYQEFGQDVHKLWKEFKSSFH